MASDTSTPSATAGGGAPSAVSAPDAPASSTAGVPTAGSQDVRLDFAVATGVPRLPEAERAEVLANPGFGKHFTDHMARAVWTPEGWGQDAVLAHGPITLSPAAAVLHYAQEVFEGLKAYRHADGSVWAFRPEANARRFAASARRLALPVLPEDAFVRSVEQLVAADVDWVPAGGENSLYLRPFMFASESFLGVRPATEVTYLVIASPAGSYFGGGEITPVSIWLSQEYSRAAPGGTGAAKCGGNYAASLQAQAEAAAHGCDQVAFLDAVEHRWVEELGGMNLFFVLDDGTVVTPALTGTILEGVTRSSVLQIARDLGHDVVERRIDVAEWREGCESGRITEVFACGTAAVVTPVGALVEPDRRSVPGDGGTGEVTAAIRQRLTDVQQGRAEDAHGWMHRLV
ncbi:branched-chain amino acid aminotransferase [uncultured Pseudokineococcus sp.]|uniref:branched-chain amino acid aminotransferase n=1 Tax=uncultured Pseudokineococcus sp. TaxID=1642928 RepID=UPI002635E03A|nr:branched-chain amino acid aminotransferase [uncultured Pseudokineococcus sp.]